MIALAKSDAQKEVDRLIAERRYQEASAIAKLCGLAPDEVEQKSEPIGPRRRRFLADDDWPKPKAEAKPMGGPPKIEVAQIVSGDGLAAIAAPKVAEQPEPEAEAEPARLPVVVPPPQLPPPPQSLWDQALAAMNEQHAIIDNVGGKTLIASWEPSQTNPERLEVVFQNKESFLLRYSNRTVPIEVPDGRGGVFIRTVPLGQWWLMHPRRRQFRGITFRPGADKVVNECWNLWRGWGVEPREGDWRLIHDHIVNVLAGGNAEFAEYIIRWIAWAIQNPGAQPEVTLVLIGEKGAGKGTLVRCLERIFGAHTFQVTSREHVIGRFNGHLQDCVLFVADEAYWGGDKRCVGRLQGMITEPKLPIERKGIDLVEVPNRLHVLMLAEPGWVIPAGRFERRYAALAVSDVRRGDKKYFKSLHAQISQGGAEAMMWDLQRLDLDGWHPREIPEALLKNPELQKQQRHNLPPLEQWYLMILHNGKLPGALPDKPNTAFTKRLVDDAKSAMPRLRYDLSEVGLRDFLLDAKRIGVVCKKYRAAKANGWSFPPLAEARAGWSSVWGPTIWDNPDVEEWIG